MLWINFFTTSRKILLISYFGQQCNWNVKSFNWFEKPDKSFTDVGFWGCAGVFQALLLLYLQRSLCTKKKSILYTYVVSLCIQTAAKQRWFRIKYAYSNGVSNFNFLTAWNSISSKEFLKPLLSRVIMYTKNLDKKALGVKGCTMNY